MEECPKCSGTGLIENPQARSCKNCGGRGTIETVGNINDIENPDTITPEEIAEAKDPNWFHKIINKAKGNSMNEEVQTAEGAAEEVAPEVVAPAQPEADEAV